MDFEDEFYDKIDEKYRTKVSHIAQDSLQQHKLTTDTHNFIKQNQVERMEA